MLENIFEEILARFPDLIEGGLHLKGRQVPVLGRRMDMVFEDQFKRTLIIELKAGAIRDKDIGQILAYEGMILSAADPTIRVMLIGSRVPPNIRRALDHHGIAWAEITRAMLIEHLKAQRDTTFLALLAEDEQSALTRDQNMTGQPSPRHKAVHISNQTGPSLSEVLPEAYSETLTVDQVRHLFGQHYIQDESQRKIYLSHARAFKTWANYIAALLLDRERRMQGDSDVWFEPKDIKSKLKEIMPFHFDKPGAKGSGLLTADVKIGSKYNLGFPVIENRAGTKLYRFTGFTK